MLFTPYLFFAAFTSFAFFSADVLIYMLEANAKFGNQDEEVLAKLSDLKMPKILVINKIDALPVFDFDFDAAEAAARKLNPSIKVFRISAKTGVGVQELANYIISKINHAKDAE